MTKTVGRFAYDPETGPMAYMQSDDYRRVMAQIKAGADPCGAFRYSPDPITALLVTVQTDYAGWHGRETFNRMRGA